MKMSVSAVLLLCLSLGLASCGKEAESLTAKAKDAMGGLDLSNMSAEAMKVKVADLLNDAKESLNKVSNSDSAKSAVEKLTPVLNNLSMLKDKLGDKMPDLSQLKEMGSSLATKFAGKTDILKHLQPLLDKIKSLVG